MDNQGKSKSEVVYKWGRLNGHGLSIAVAALMSHAFYTKGLSNVNVPKCVCALVAIFAWYAIVPILYYCYSNPNVIPSYMRFCVPLRKKIIEWTTPLFFIAIFIYLIITQW